GRLALVGDAEPGDPMGIDTGQRLAQRAYDRDPDRLRVVLHLPGTGGDLGDLSVPAAPHNAPAVDQQHGRPRGPLVDGYDQILLSRHELASRARTLSPI